MPRTWSIGTVLVLISCNGSADLGGGPVSTGYDAGYETGAIVDASTDQGSAADVAVSSDAGAPQGSCDPSKAWPVMLSAPFVPGSAAANLDLNHAGVGVVPRSYAESVNCALVPFDAGWLAPSSWPPQVYGVWGAHEEVLVAVDPTTQDLTIVSMQGSYAGVLAFTSRAGGAYGQHSYTIRVGQLERDGSPMTIDWSSLSPLDEILDGLAATYAPSFASLQDCDAAGSCVWGYASPTDGGPGDDAYYLAIYSISLGVGFTSVGQGGLPQWMLINLPAGLPAGALDAGTSD